MKPRDPRKMPVRRMSKIFAIIRIRGSMETRGRVERGLKDLHLTRKNHCILAIDSPQLKGYLILMKDFVSWGDISKENTEKLFKTHSEVSGGAKLTDEYLQKNSKYKSIAEFAHAFFDCQASMKDVAGLKPMFRLHPPIKGFDGGIKQPYPKGSLGFRKDGINKLIVRMM
jgi:large subunit ribosomal protein L30